MSDADALTFILDDGRRRNVPRVLSQNRRAVASARAPDFELVRPKEDVSAAEMLPALLGADVEPVEKLE